MELGSVWAVFKRVSPSNPEFIDENIDSWWRAFQLRCGQNNPARVSEYRDHLIGELPIVRRQWAAGGGHRQISLLWFWLKRWFRPKTFRSDTDGYQHACDGRDRSLEAHQAIAVVIRSWKFIKNLNMGCHRGQAGAHSRGEWWSGNRLNFGEAYER